MTELWRWRKRVREEPPDVRLAAVPTTEKSEGGNGSERKGKVVHPLGRCDVRCSHKLPKEEDQGKFG